MAFFAAAAPLTVPALFWRKDAAMMMSGDSAYWSRARYLAVSAAVVLSTVHNAQGGLASVASSRPAGVVTRYAGWAMDAYPGDTTTFLATQMQRQIGAGANVVWLGHDNPGDVGYYKREPGLSFAVWMAYRDPKASRHADAVAMIRAQQHALDAAQTLHIPIILPIGYQSQMGMAWNLAHPQDARRLADGSVYDGPNPINIDAAFQSPDYQRDILAYYRWIDTTFVRPYIHTILMLNLADEPQRGDYSTWADRAFRATHGYGLREAGSDPKRQEEVGRFESDYAVDYAAWSAKQWLSIDSAVSVTMSFDGGYGRYMHEGPDLEDIFSLPPANFVVTFDAFPRDGLYTTPLHDTDLIELFNLVRTLGHYSAVYDRPLWLWSTANSWGLNEASPDPGNIADAVANGIYLAQLARQTGGDLRGIVVWNFNIKGQGLFNDVHRLSYDPDQMFARVSASFSRLRSIMRTSPGQPDTAVLAPNSAELRTAGAKLLPRAQDPYQWDALAVFARANIAAVIVTSLDLSTLPDLRTVLVLARTPADVSAADGRALSTLLTHGGTVLAASGIARSLSGGTMSVHAGIAISATHTITVDRLRTPAGTLLAVDGAPVEDLFSDALASQAEDLWRQILHRPVFTTGFVVAAGGVTLLYTIAHDGSSMILDPLSGSRSGDLMIYDTHGVLQRTIHMVNAGGSVRVDIARRSYGILPAITALSVAGSAHASQVYTLTKNTRPALPPQAGHPTDPVKKRPGTKYFSNHGHNLSGQFLDFWLKNGGIYTIGEPWTEVIPLPDLQGHPAQYFDRFLLEQINGKIQAAPLGIWMSKGNPDPAFKPKAKCPSSFDKYVAGHCIQSGRFLNFWKKFSSLLGTPISEATYETNGDGSGNQYLLQWFQNARLEFHPGNQGKWTMELGLLGNQYLHKIGWLPVKKNP
jgi:hypothetical protein